MAGSPIKDGSARLGGQRSGGARARQKILWTCSDISLGEGEHKQLCLDYNHTLTLCAAKIQQRSRSRRVKGQFQLRSILPSWIHLMLPK